MAKAKITRFLDKVSKEQYRESEREGKFKRVGGEDISHILDFLSKGGILIEQVSIGDTLLEVGRVFDGETIRDLKMHNGAIIVVTPSREFPADDVPRLLREQEERRENERRLAEEQKRKSPVHFDILTNQILGSYPMSLRILGLLRKREETPKQFLINFFTNFNNTKPTIFTGSKETQTEPGKRRSLGDIFMIMRYYYPEITLKEVVTFLHKDLPRELKGFRSSYCSTIKKRTFYYDSDKDTRVLNIDTFDEFGFSYKSYLD